MQSTHRVEMPANRVMALFGDSALSFNLSNGATFADLAVQLDHLSDRHIGMPTAIYLKFATTQPFIVL
jgi:hypothetical protein